MVDTKFGLQLKNGSYCRLTIIKNFDEIILNPTYNNQKLIQIIIVLMQLINSLENYFLMDLKVNDLYFKIF